MESSSDPMSSPSCDDSSGELIFFDDSGDGNRSHHSLEHVHATSVQQQSTQHDKNDDSPEAIVRVENRVITWVRCLVLVVLVLAASATVTFVYVYTHNSEIDTFISEYEAVASTMTKSLLLDLQLSFWLARTLASTVTLAMEATGQPATNMTISPHRWEAITQHALYGTYVEIASWIPFLYTDNDRQSFEEYARENVSRHDGSENPPCYLCGGDPNLAFENVDDLVDVPGIGFYSCGQLDEGARKNRDVPENACPVLMDIVQPVCRCSTQSTISSVDMSEVVPWTIDQGLFRLLESDDASVPVSREHGTSPYAPMYVTSGATQEPILYDQLSDPFRAKTLGILMFGRTPTVSEMRIRSNFYDRYVLGSYLEGEPTSDLYFPVFDPNPVDPQLVGAVALELRWPRILNGGIPVNADLLTVVIKNTCGQSYTYSVDQAERALQFQGNRDMHDPKYNNWVHSTTYEEFDQLLGVVSNGIPISNATDPSHCLYRFEVYPTQAMENTYVTNEPIIFAVVSAVIFLFTSLIFVAYDMIVRRRQVKVMASAKRTNEIVSSLFPESVRQRLYSQVHAADQTPDSLLQGSTMSPSVSHDNETIDGNIFGSEPIADLFPHATVMFIDIAGFTAWSSEREPSQVFTLLENLYHAFDDVGKKLGVFKVETIGDSYVAVAGLPTPRKDHAVGKCKTFDLSLFSLYSCIAHNSLVFIYPL
jgi:hypothetical protein